MRNYLSMTVENTERVVATYKILLDYCDGGMINGSHQFLIVPEIQLVIGVTIFLGLDFTI